MAKSRQKKKMRGRNVEDALVNYVSGKNTCREASSGNMFKAQELDRSTLDVMYRFDWISQKICNIIPEDMTREWRHVKSVNKSAEQLKDFKNQEEYFGVKEKCYEAMLWARLYGGCVILPVIDGQEDVSKPFDITKMKKGSLKGFNVIDRHYIYPQSKIETNPFSIYYNLPKYYTVNGSNGKIHRSWLIFFDGQKLPRWENNRNQYWGQSILENLYQNILNAGSVGQAIVAMMEQNNVDTVQINGLNDALASCKEADKELIRNRFEEYAYLKSAFNLIVMDGEETLTRQQIGNLSGLSILVEQFLTICSGGSDIPVTRLIGTSAKGLSATGEGDMNNYYDNVKSKQKKELMPRLREIDAILMMNLWGEIDEDFENIFNPLHQETASEKSARELQDAQRDQIYFMMNVVTEDVLAKQLTEDGVYNIPQDYIEEMENAVSFDEDDEEVIIEGDDDGSSGESETKTEDEE